MLLHFSRKSSLFNRLYVQNGLADFDFFWLKLLMMIAFQDMLRAIQNFLYFNSVPPKNGLW